MLVCVAETERRVAGEDTRESIHSCPFCSEQLFVTTPADSDAHAETGDTASCIRAWKGAHEWDFHFQWRRRKHREWIVSQGNSECIVDIIFGLCQLK